MMKKTITVLTTVFLSLLCAVSAHAETVTVSSSEEFTAAMSEFSNQMENPVTSQSEDGNFASCRLLVVSEVEPDMSDVRDVIYDGDNYYVLFCDSEKETETVYERLVDDDMCVMPDVTISADTTAVSAAASLSETWDKEYIKSEKMNDYLEYLYGDNLPTVKVAVIDTGVDYTHTELADRINLSGAYDYVNDDKDPMDDNKHGTHVAGIICRNTLSNVEITPYKILDSSGSGDSSNLLYAVKEAARVGNDVINLSLASKYSDSTSTKLSSALKEIINDDGVVVVSATGNISSVFTQGTAYPAAFDGVIGVASCDYTGTVASSSNWDEFGMVDVTAPGVLIYSTVLNNGYAWLSGTSMATPHVAAAAAMLKTYDSSYTSSTIEAMLKETADASGGTTEYVNKYGAGVINLGNLRDTLTREPDTLPQLVETTSLGLKVLRATMKSPGSAATAVVACYNDGVLDRVMSQTYLYSQTLRFSIVPTDYDSIKILVLRDMDSLKPLSTVYTAK